MKLSISPYALAIRHYKITGDKRSLADLIRVQDIPKEFKDDVAQILMDDFEHNKGSSSIAQSYNKILFYQKLHSIQVNHHYETLSKLVINGLLPSSHLDGIKKLNYTERQLVQMFADEFFVGDYDTARRTIYQLVKQHSLPKFEK